MTKKMTKEDYEKEYSWILDVLRHYGSDVLYGLESLGFFEYNYNPNVKSVKIEVNLDPKDVPELVLVLGLESGEQRFESVFAPPWPEREKMNFVPVGE